MTLLPGDIHHSSDTANQPVREKEKTTEPKKEKYAKKN